MKYSLAIAILTLFPTLGFSQKPNIVLFLVDDMGYMDIGAYGSEFYETPVVDQLAKDGMMFTNGYAAAPICSPTRWSILFGTSPARSGMTQFVGGAGNPVYPKTIPQEETTIGEALKQAGYATAFFGKWHLNNRRNDNEAHWPNSHGFDVNVGGHHRGGLYIPNEYFSPYDIPNIENGPPGEYMTDRLANDVSAWIEKEKDGPFFAYFSFYSVHNPQSAPQDRIDPFVEKQKEMGLTKEQRFTKDFGRRNVRLRQDHPTYAAMVQSVDMAVRKVLDKLEELNLTENTIVIFFSDNGGLSVTEGTPTSCMPYKAGKGFLYEGGIKVPLIVKWPGVIQPGSKSDAFVVSTDFYPTILEMAGLDLMPEQHKDGKSFVGLLNQQRKEIRSTLYFHYPHRSNQGGRPSSAIRVGDYKLIDHYENNNHRLELYNLAEDIGENNNLADSKPDLADSLLGMLQRWQEESGAKYPKGYSKIPGIEPVPEVPVDETVTTRNE